MPLDLVRRVAYFNGTKRYRFDFLGAMMLERDSRGPGDQTVLEAPQSESPPLRGKGEPHGPAADETDWLRSPPRRGQLFDADDDLEPQERRVGGEAHNGRLARHPIAAAFGLLCALLALPAGYIYWDYASHFETTDDAYIAARQFAIAPKCRATSQPFRSPTTSTPQPGR
jgi:hypothetical protein